MSHFGVQHFTSSNCNNNNSMSISPDGHHSPPMPIPDSMPVQAASSSPASNLVGLVSESATSKVSVMVQRKKESTASAPLASNEFHTKTKFPTGSLDWMPTLEPAATRLSGVEQELEEGLGSPSASLNIIATRRRIQHSSRGEQNQAVQTDIVQNDTTKNFSYHTSGEARKILSCGKLLQCSKKGHTWSHPITIEVHKKKVTVRIFIFPRVSDSNRTQTTKLDVTADISRKLLRILKEADVECQIMVKTEVWDTTAGQNMCCTQFNYHTVSMDDGKVNFRQDLVPCEKVKECRSESVDLVVKVTLRTRQNDTYKVEEVDGYLSIKMPTVARRQQ